MNINAGTNSYNISLTKFKEEKRPTFATIFDKLDSRSKRLNNKNPLNAVMTNEQMYRYYLEEVEPMVQGSDSGNLDALDEILGNKDFKDMKLSEFAKLLMGNVNDDRGVKYETLAASVSSNGVMSIAPIAPPTPTPTRPPTPTPSVPMSSGTAPVMGSLGVSGATGVGLSAPVASSTPVVASSTPAVASSAPVVASTPSAATPVAAPVASSTPAAAPAVASAPSAAPAAAASGLSVSIPATLSAAASTFSPSAVFAALTGTPTATAAAGSKPSGTSVPPSAVASSAPTAVAPTPTPASGALTPTTLSPSTAASSSVAAIETGGYNEREKISAYRDAIAKGLNPPFLPKTSTKTIIKDKEMVKYAIDLKKYNDSLKPEDKVLTIKPTSAIDKIIKKYDLIIKNTILTNDEDIIKEIMK